ncbi:unnamed protein product [Zymoseptoria tritici ST99CH_1A5]|uniref:Uncharacterized protein n=3 Tax=Zymoseptoria tritici TaxID=1047171 RepID=A0A1X7RMT3_ZYMT9|nr:unnamed protein product [Zymoseptoria tritici ST99CH_3D7]SMR48526.1 unnamed protein product [Zymoseptoria tritici ST99CH_1E4]SMR49709.1 unnamed protein product [Zymoseptoria tritici ST99CH_3D1]SMY22406.1 unnamed protein product [Zymoseptoria tritici ST99CH_1A5]
MDARIDRDAHIRSLASSSRVRGQTWYEWFWKLDPPKAELRTTDAATSEILKAHFTELLDRVDPPDTFKARDVVEALTDKELRDLGYKKQEDAIPAVYELAFEMREFGDCELLRKGQVLGDEVGLRDLDGPIRIRKKEW